jgi:hypothetical protein
MNMFEARLRIWERMATTARADVDNGDWVVDESEDADDQARLLLACDQVADSIESHIRRAKKRSR